jgi:DNA recombination protein RmuC
VDQRLSRWETERTSQHAGLSEQLRALAIAQQKLHGETAGLVQALRAPQVRGRWGEIQLQRVVELAGMLEHCDFYQQPSASTDDGRLRPDLIVRLPGDRQVVIDAKCALDAYLDAQQADTDLLRREKLTAHARQVRQHIQRLSAKAYWDQFQPAPEFVVLFLPGESFFSAALEQDPSLIEAGADRKVLLATPTTLIALLRAVAYGWRQEQTARHAQAIADLGRELHDRIRILTDHLAAMGTGLQTAVTAYNQAVASLETRLLVSARRFRDLGVAADRDIPVLNPLETQPRSLDSTPPTPPPPSQP